MRLDFLSLGADARRAIRDSPTQDLDAGSTLVMCLPAMLVSARIQPLARVDCPCLFLTNHRQPEGFAMLRRSVTWLFPSALFVVTSPGFAQNVADVNVLPADAGEVTLGITWEWPPWGAQMQVEYGDSPSYGAGSAETVRAGYPIRGADRVTIQGLQPGAIYHYRVVVKPIGGPPGQSPFLTGDHVVAAGATDDHRVPSAPTATEICKGNCPENDTECRLGCDSDPSYFDKVLALCQSRCRADDPDCEGLCHTNLRYVSLAPVWTVKGVTMSCPAGYSPIGVHTEVDWDCSPPDSDFCKGRIVYSARATLSCAIVLTTQQGTYYVREHDLEKETLCSTKRGIPQKIDEEGWWTTAFGELECFGDDAATNCRVRCPE